MSGKIFSGNISQPRAFRMKYLRYLAYGSAVSTYVLIVIGGYVAASSSGLACRDWPTCNGQLIPTFTSPILVEYTHRVFAVVVSLFVTATLVVVWLRYRGEKSILFLSSGAFILLMIQILVGRVTVTSNLDAVITDDHLAVASGVFAV